MSSRPHFFMLRIVDWPMHELIDSSLRFIVRFLFSNTFQTGDCLTQTLRYLFYWVFLVACTFEDFGNGDPWCRWVNDLDNYQWKRRNQGTPSTDTGPTFDHTLGTDQGEPYFKRLAQRFCQSVQFFLQLAIQFYS